MRIVWKKTAKISQRWGLPPNPHMPSAAEGSVSRSPRCYSYLLLHLQYVEFVSSA